MAGAPLPLHHDRPGANARHEGAGGSVTISGGSMVNDTTWHTLLTTWRPHFFGLYLDGNLVASSTAANTATSTAWSIFRFGWGFSTTRTSMATSP